MKWGLVASPDGREDWAMEELRDYVSGRVWGVEVESQWAARERERLGIVRLGFIRLGFIG